MPFWTYSLISLKFASIKSFFQFAISSSEGKAENMSNFKISFCMVSIGNQLPTRAPITQNPQTQCDHEVDTWGLICMVYILSQIRLSFLLCPKYCNHIYRIFRYDAICRRSDVKMSLYMISCFASCPKHHECRICVFKESSSLFYHFDYIFSQLSLSFLRCPKHRNQISYLRYGVFCLNSDVKMSQYKISFFISCPKHHDYIIYVLRKPSNFSLS